MSKEYYRYQAVQCLQLADQTDNPTQKASLIRMAQAWLHLVDQAEKNRHCDLVYETPSAPDGRSATRGDLS